MNYVVITYVSLSIQSRSAANRLYAEQIALLADRILHGARMPMAAEEKAPLTGANSSRS
jgi:hypothetical protein